MDLSSRVADEVARAGRSAALSGDDITTCPYSGQDSPAEAALARRWVGGYLAARPPTAVDYDEQARTPDEAARALGHDTTPGHDELHHYWVAGDGLPKWKGSPKPWTTLVALLTPHVGPEKAKVYASAWFHEVFGFYAGSDLNRVTHGHPPRGHRVGPG